MTLDLDEQEVLVLVTALKAAVNITYGDAWKTYGPNGRRPHAGMHEALMGMGDRMRALGRRLGDKMD